MTQILNAESNVVSKVGTLDLTLFDSLMKKKNLQRLQFYKETCINSGYSGVRCSCQPFKFRNSEDINTLVLRAYWHKL